MGDKGCDDVGPGSERQFTGRDLATQQADISKDAV